MSVNATMIQSTEVTTAPQATLKQVGGQPHRVRGAGPHRASPARLRQRRRAFAAAVVMAGGAFALGAVAGAGHVPEAERSVSRFAAAWERGDFAAMYSELSAPERGRVRRGAFAAAYQRALGTATATRVTTGKPVSDGDAYRVPVRVDTRIWGAVRGTVRV